MDKKTASENFSLIGMDSSNQEIAMTLYIWDEIFSSEVEIGLQIEYDNKIIEAIADNFFYALREIRLNLEYDNILLKCYGASKNVFPSPMILEGEARYAYKLTLGEAAKQSDLVSIFATGDDIIPSTISQQAEYYSKWCESLS